MTDSLLTAQDAARAWNVNHKRACARIAHIHAKHGAGRKVRGQWRLTQEEVEQYAPDPKFRKRSTAPAVVCNERCDYTTHPTDHTA